MTPTVLILGGYGNTGLPTARLLLQESNVRLILAGRDLAQAEAAAHALEPDARTPRVQARRVDAADPASLRTAFADVDLVVVAASTTAYTRQVAEAALDAGADYLDTQLSSPAKLEALRQLAPRIQAEGRCFITDGGFHPGVPAALVRYAAEHIDALEKANVSGAFQLDWAARTFSEETMAEFVDEMRHSEPTVFHDGAWVRRSMLTTQRFAFGPLFGERYTVPMLMEELRTLPEHIPTLHEIGFYIAGFNPVTDSLVLPIVWLACKLLGDRALQPAARWFMWSLERFSRPPYGGVLQLEAEGLRDGQPHKLLLRLTHADAYVLTAVPVVACLLQYFDGSLRHPGLHLQALAVEPSRFVHDLERLGLTVTCSGVPTQETKAIGS